MYRSVAAQLLLDRHDKVAYEAGSRGTAYMVLSTTYNAHHRRDIHEFRTPKGARDEDPFRQFPDEG